MNELNLLLGLIPKDRSDPIWEDDDFLSKLIIKLSVCLVNLAQEISQAELLEISTKVGYLEMNQPGDKKMTVSEADANAIRDTGNQYKLLKLNYDATIEIIQSLKKRLDIREYERKLP